jgi:Glycosyl hydrolase family 81 N-terminal domain
LVSHRAWLQPDESTRVYTVPYIVDTAPAAAAVDDADTTSFAQQMQAGLRVHWPTVQANDRNMQMVDDWKNGLCLGTTDAQFNVNGSASPLASRYHVVDPGAFYSDDDDDGKNNNRNAGHSMSRLGLVLEWSGDGSSSSNISNTDGATSSSNNGKRRMVSPIVRGMPYVTMEYHGGVLPTLYSYNGPSPDGPAIVIDDDQEIQCGTRTMINNATATSDATTSYDASVGSETALVQKEVRLHFINSDFTWIVFFSQPVRIRCDVSAGDEKLRDFSLSVVSIVANEVEGDREDANLDMTADEKREPEPLAVRVALLDQCTTGHGNIKEHCTQALVHGNTAAQDKTTYAQMLRNSAHVVPVNPNIQFQYPSSTKSDNDDELTDSSTTTQMTIDWGARATATNRKELGEDLLMFAMPHHQDLLASTDVNVTDVCFQTFHGRTCLVLASTWKLSHETNRSNAVSFAAPRPPAVDFIPTLAKALEKDINYKLSDNLKRAAADTYFSGKILARLSRVVVMTAEMQRLAQSADDDKVKEDLTILYHDADESTLSSAAQAAAKADWPSDKHLQTALAELKTGVQAWMDTNAEAPYIYDTSWGGLVNCGCHYVGWDVGNGDKGHCNNTFPNCPALASVNEDFGNGTCKRP